MGEIKINKNIICINDMQDMKISVIIPVKNQADKIENCLKAISEQTLKPYEVIVVDGHSTDGTVEKAMKFPVKILYENYHTRAGACQIGVESAKGKYVAFTDADCIPERDWLENLIKEFDESIVGVGGGIKNIGEGLWKNSINLAMGTFLGSANSVQGRLFEDKRYVKSISGCNSMYRREDILKIGGFDVKLSTVEDTELNRKLLRSGKLVYTPDAIILHDHKRGLKEFAKRMYQYGYGRGRNFIYDVQVIPPFLGLITIFFLFIWIKVFFFMITLYTLLIFIFTFYIIVKSRDFKYLFTVPIVYFMEHILYGVGFWLGIIRKQL